MVEVEEKHILHKELFVYHGKQVWLLKVYYPNQGGVVKTIYAPEQEEVVDLTNFDQTVEPVAQPLDQPQEVPQVTENVL